MQFVRLLELGLVLRTAKFPGFEVAFNPGEINWSVDAEPFMQQIAYMEQGAFFCARPCYHGNSLSYVYVTMPAKLCFMDAALN